MKIMLYSQHVLGIGHFFRSMEIAKALHHHEVLFVEGGDALPGFVPPPHVKRLLLPALMMDPDFKQMQARDGAVDAVQSERQRRLMEAFMDFNPEVLVTELFPFGRKRFRPEIVPVLEKTREPHRRTRVVCSLRVILVEKKHQAAYEEGVIELLNTHFDLLLVHSDPGLIALEETFHRVADIRVPIHYTGFVVRQAPPRRKYARGKRIVASSGGGRVGSDLLAATILAVRTLPDEALRLRVFVGPFTEEADRLHLADLAAQDPRVALLPFSLDFPAELARSDCSISMAGYNTCMDILSAGVRALVHPFPQNREQALRAGKLEAAGVLRVVESLEAESLALAIREVMESPMPVPREAIDLEGARNTALVIERCCGSGGNEKSKAKCLQ